ncbi:unnamed protein product [Vitrella brassicaformis CCMP3155]|uniref:Ferrochelatase n=1 Tax=Vitrella brassicaformis (strain CCMP3155) TaxID=1169540 RepID=A0A0G4H5D7_VITBC|nr:unnamed protein product [Vitrella brassicaformis CCMP3155]|eukprot:CEM38978.1 unnamed protein product [Vitrella brassicaformis CCMP3155]
MEMHQLDRRKPVRRRAQTALTLISLAAASLSCAQAFLVQPHRHTRTLRMGVAAPPPAVRQKPVKKDWLGRVKEPPESKVSEPKPTLREWMDASIREWMNVRDARIGVLILNLGGPLMENDVESFLFNLFMDGEIFRLPAALRWLQEPLAYLISKARSPKTSEAYRSIGGGSPILGYTQAQGEALTRQLRRMGYDAQTYIAMRYSAPYTRTAVTEMLSDNVDGVVILPLYPHFSVSTSGSSINILKKYSRMFIDMPHTVVTEWYDRPGYTKAVANLIQREIDSFTADERREGIHVLFSAHGVPKSYIQNGDPYQDHIVKTIDTVKRQYSADVSTHLSYQSKVGPVEWLQPYTDDMIESLAKQGVKNLVVVPISFVSEHIETLEEIDIEYRHLAHEKGIRNWRRVPALNVDPLFIKDLAELVAESLDQPVLSLNEVCFKKYKTSFEQYDE